MDDTLAFYGGAVKALGNGKLEGYGVLYTGVADPDVQEEFFSKSTDLMLTVGDKRPLLYRHGTHPTIKSRMAGPATVTKLDDIGVFFEGELDISDKYWKAIYKLAEMGKLGFSTGSMPHLVSKAPRSENGKKAVEILCWPVGELSLTPNPVEPRTCAFPVKSLSVEDDVDLEAMVKSMDEEQSEASFDTAGLPKLDQFCKDVSPNSGVTGEERSKSAVDAVKEFITAGNVLGEAFGVYTSRLLRRTENRALKHADPVHPDTAVQVVGLLTEMDRALSAFGSVKEVLSDLKHLSDLSKAEQQAMMLKARHSLLNYYRISGYKPEELQDAGTSTSQQL